MKLKLVLFFLLILISLNIKLYLAFNYDTGDTGAINKSTHFFLKKKPVYSNPQVHLSIPPFQLHILSMIQTTEKYFHNPNGLWKIPAIIADIGIAILIYLILKNFLKKPSSKALIGSVFYLLNPITIFVSGFHGQTESVWIFFILLSWYLLVVKKRSFLSSIMLGLAISFKLPAVLLALGFIGLLQNFKKGILYFFNVFCIFILSLIPELIIDADALIKQVFFYSSTPNIWGLTLIIGRSLMLDINEVLKFSLVLKTFLLILTGGYMYYHYCYYPKRFFIFCQTVLIIFFIFTPGFGTQYLLWLLPFLILTKSVFLLSYTILTSLAYLHTYGINYLPLENIINYLQQNFYYPNKILYPYDLYLPIWLLLFPIFKESISILKNNKRVK